MPRNVTQLTIIETEALANIARRRKEKRDAGWWRCITCDDYVEPDVKPSEHRKEFHPRRSSTRVRVPVATRRGGTDYAYETLTAGAWWDEGEDPWTPDGPQVKATTPVHRSQFSDLRIERELRALEEQERTYWTARRIQRQQEDAEERARAREESSTAESTPFQ